jgi:addiction module HigA family antidote
MAGAWQVGRVGGDLGVSSDKTYCGGTRSIAVAPQGGVRGEIVNGRRIEVEVRACARGITGNESEVNMVTKTKKLRPIHPGEVLKDVLDDAHLSANALALALRIPANRVTEIVNGRRSISADTALRLARYFGTSAQMWMNLQAKYDLQVAEDTLGRRIEVEVARMREGAA